MPDCPACGRTNPAGARFCILCGTPLPIDTPALGAARKIVTVVFCDVAGSTPLGERLDPESVHDLMTRFFEEMRGVLEHHGGTVEKYIGDAVMAVFGVPLLHEDDALRAVRAADEMRSALSGIQAELESRFGARIEVRIGVNTGEVAVGDTTLGQSLVVGDAVNVAARLEQSALPGEILLGADTYALTRDLVDAEAVEPLSLKGKSTPVIAYRLRAVAPVGSVARPEPAIVDRVEDMQDLRAAFEETAAERRCRLVLLLGSAGVGKSRLAREFSDSLGADAHSLSGRCLPYGDGITFWPIREVVRQACGLAETDGPAEGRAKIDALLRGWQDDDLIADRVAGVSGLGPASARLEETFWAIRRFLERLSSDRPLVVAFDDIHWGEPTFLDLLEYLAGWSRDAPLLFICMARPDLLEVRPTWGGVAGEIHPLWLRPLSPADSEELVGNLLGPARLESQAVAHITDVAGGNPLFVEEMLRMLEDEGLLQRREGTWEAAGDLSDVPAPATIHALVSARLDRLSADERTVIRCAAVVGREFWWGAVAHLVAESLRPAVGGHLQTLVRKELIRPAPSAFHGEDAFGFHHQLIQEAAYQGTPKDMRADLHARFADWIEARAGERVVEYEEVLGHHLEQAFRTRGELGPLTDNDVRLAARAAERLGAAGRRAHGRGDMPAAADLLGRATDLYPSDDPRRLSLLPDLGEALMETGDLSAAEETLASAIRQADELGDRGTASHAKVIRLLMLESTDPKERSEEALRELASVVPVFEELGDDLGLARAWRLVGDVHLARCRYSDADEALQRAIEHARRAGASWEEAEALGQYAGSGVYGSVPVDEVVRRCEQILASAKGNRAMEARAWRGLAHAAAMQGRSGEAIEYAERARAILEDLGLRLRASFTAETLGFIAHLGGDHAAAERALRAGFEVATEFGEQAYTSTVAALLSQELAEQGHLEEAERFISVSVEQGAEDDLTTQIVWRGAQALVLASRGAHGEAGRVIRDAVELARGTDDVNMRADTLMTLAQVLEAHDPAAAGAAAREALELYRAKGNIVSASDAERRLAKFGA